MIAEYPYRLPEEPETANLDKEWYFVFRDGGYFAGDFGKYIGGAGTIYEAKQLASEEPICGTATIATVEDSELRIVASATPAQNDAYETVFKWKCIYD